MLRTKLSQFMGNQSFIPKNIVIIDANNLAYRVLFIAHLDYKAKKDVHIFNEKEKEYTVDDMYSYWRHLFLNNIFRTIREFKPEELYICFDSRSWRKEIYPEYKANRQASKDKSEIDFEQFYSVIDEFQKDIKTAFPCFHVLKIPRCEADDLIAIITKNKASESKKLLIISSDRDMVQLQQYKNVEQYDPINKKYVKSIDPKKDLTLKILTGDSGDNIPAIKPRVGIKTAEKMLVELDLHLSNNDLMQNYLRNRQLISFEYIPEDIINTVEHELSTYPIQSINAMNVLLFLTKKGLRKIADDLQLYVPYLKNLK